MNYYNEYDKKAAAWLRELIKVGAIPDGHVDERSIAEVSPDDLRSFTQCHFFAGIGGWSLALQLAGWSSDRPVWTGSCPCQPFSVAGKGLGAADERHLWPIFARLIRECKPATVFGEQVASKAGREWLGGVFADLEGMGYSRAGADLCAASVNAPHIRQRLYWVADSECGRQQEQRISIDIESKQQEAVFDASGCSADSWKQVSFAGECLGGDENELGDICSLCGLDYCEECECPGPTEDGYEYDERDGVLYARRVGNSDNTRLGQQCGAVSVPTEQPSSELRSNAGFWSSAIWHPCRDGKARRIEPSIFPLVDGVSGRVGLLRGAGNAIVPQVAAEFIGAFMDVTTTTPSFISV